VKPAARRARPVEAPMSPVPRMRMRLIMPVLAYLLG
jgi:hypothetical protein